jgi:hypothetical protein
MNGVELLTLTGEDDGDEGARGYPDDVFTGGQLQRRGSGVPQLQLVSGVTSWVKENPVIAGALAVAAVYLIYRVIKKRR